MLWIKSVVYIILQTPPRVLKLDEHYFPSADDFTPPPSENNHDFAIVRSKPRKDLDLDNDGRLDVRSATLYVNICLVLSVVDNS